VHQPFERAAAEAVRVLNDLISGAATEPQHVVLPTKLVRRRSA
jgi:DNA-binding LacI/PurR family transcriptional regulator